MKERTTLYLDSQLHKDFKEICVREEESMSKKVESWIARYVAVHREGNPQTLLFTLDFQNKKKCCWVGCERQLSPSETTKVKFRSGMIGHVCDECLSYLKKKTEVVKKIYKRR